MFICGACSWTMVGLVPETEDTIVPWVRDMNDGLTVASCCSKELVAGMSSGVKPADEEVVVATAVEREQIPEVAQLMHLLSKLQSRVQSTVRFYKYPLRD